MSDNRFIRFNKGDILFQAGDSSREMYIIRSGTVKIMIKKEDKLIPLTELGRGNYVGEMSFLTGSDRSATVIADTPVTANKITPDVLQEENLGISSWAVSIARVLVRRIRATTELLGDYILSKDMETHFEGRRAEDQQAFQINQKNLLNPGRLYLRGHFKEDSIEILKVKIRELKSKKIQPLILDFSDIINIDQAGINYLYNLTQSSDLSNEVIQIDNIQLIKEKILSIQGIQTYLATTEIPMKRIDKGDRLITQGETGSTMYVVKNGAFNVQRETKSGPINLALAESGDVIGEMSLIKEGVRSATVTAEKPSIVYTLDIQQFYNNAYNVPGWFMELIQGLVQRLRDTNEMLDQIGKEDNSSENIDNWKTPFSIVVDSQHPGKYVIKGVLSLPNLQYLVQLLKLEIKRQTKAISLDLTEISHMDKETISALLTLYTQLKSKGISMEIKGPQKDIMLLFKQYDVEE